MRLCVFGDWRLGVEVGKGVVDITDLIQPDVPGPHRMTALIERWHVYQPAVEAAVARRGAVTGEVALRAPQPRPGKVIAAPVNYRLHQLEMGGEKGVYAGQTIKTIETYAGFIKASSSIVGPGSAIELPFPDRRVDYEGELGVIVGRRAVRVSSEEALEHVFGYLPVLDISMRGEEDRSFRKSFDTFTPMGPTIITADEVPDPHALTLELALNGEIRQKASTGEMIYGIARLLELYSGAMTLEPGDVIATGTPSGVGEIRPGDEVVLAISRVGTLRMSVRSRAPLVRQ